MNIYEHVQSYLNLQIFGTADNPISKEKALEVVPKPYHFIVDKYYHFIESYGDQYVSKIYVHRGMLRFEGRDRRYPEDDYAIRMGFNFAPLSMKKSCVSGEKCYRRKAIFGWPCLTTEEYIQYMNETPEDSNHGFSGRY